MVRTADSPSWAGLLPARDSNGALPLDLRARTGRSVARFTTVVIALVLVARVLLREAPGADTRVLLMILGPLFVAVAVIAWTPWHRRLRPRQQEVLLHLIAVAPPVVLIGGAVLLPNADPGGLAFMALAVLFFGLLLPPRSHAAFSLLLVAAGASLIALDTDIGWLALWPTLATGAVAVVVGAAAILHARVLHAADDSASAAERSSAALRAVVDAAHAAADDDPQSVLDAVATAALFMESDRGAILVPDGDGALRYGALRGYPAGAELQLLSADVGVVGAAIATGSTVVWREDDERDHALEPSAGEGLRAAIAIPILVEGQLAGVLVAGRVAGDAYDGPVVRAMELLASHAERALSLTRIIDGDRRDLEQLRIMERRQDAFITTVSHELRTPVTIIDGMARTLVDRFHDLDVATAEQLMERLSANTATLRGIVTSLLDTARLRDGLVPSLALVDLEVLVRDCVDRLEPVAADHALRVRCEAEVVVQCDSDLLQRVVDNLLSNAVHHTPPGTAVVVSVLTDDDHVTVEVADDGPGIEPDLLSSVTERFVRRHGESATGHRGLGIGLSLAEEILQLHGSTLRVESTLGAGSRFSFDLPLV